MVYFQNPASDRIEIQQIVCVRGSGISDLTKGLLQEKLKFFIVGVKRFSAGFDNAEPPVYSFAASGGSLA
jgi:hypothetical protein